MLLFHTQLCIFSAKSKSEEIIMADVRSLYLREVLALDSEHAGAQAFWIATFAILTAAGAQFEIPTQPVPFTFQTFFVLLSGAMLGKRNGFVSMSLYLVLGVAGLPVFSTGGFGLARLLGPTGGYLLSFPIAAFVIGYLISHRPMPVNNRESLLNKLMTGYAWTLGSMVLGLLIVFMFGTIQLKIVYFQHWGDAIRSGFLIFSLWDVLKLFAAATIAQQFVRR
jgi:biotin transport system substrate-specific component